MIPCLIPGDSIGVDIGRSMHECVTRAKVGVPSGAIVGYAAEAAVCIVSAGSNDPVNPRLAANLEAIRARCGHKVIWVLPIHPHARSVVRVVAARHGDTVMSFAPARDNVHPRSVAPLVAQIRSRK